MRAVEQGRVTLLTSHLLGARCSRTGAVQTFGTLHISPLVCEAARVG